MRFPAPRLAGGFLLSIALALAGCGSTTTVTKTVTKTLTTPAPAAKCPPGASYMGCASGVSAKSSATAPVGAVVKTPASAPLGCKIADTSQWQGHPNWAAAKPYLCGGIAKAGEYVEDPDFVYSYTTLRALGMWHTSYWFVRNTGCVAEAQHYIAVLRSVGYTHDALAGPPVLDMEVREAAGYAFCLASQLHAALGVWPEIYTAPGTWPGGSNAGLGLWIADYGSGFPCMWTCHPVAWQFASPPFVYFYVRGLGYQDESVNYSFTSLRPFAVNYGVFLNTVFRFGSVRLNERLTVERFDKHHTYVLRAYLHLLAGRIAHVALFNSNGTRRRHPAWGVANRGPRYQLLITRSER